MESLSGSVERITFYNPDNGYSVLRLRPEGGLRGKRPKAVGRDGLVTATGNLPELVPGEYLQLRGDWVNHPKHGLQFQIEYCEQSTPASIAGVRRYLGSGLVRGIGPRLADRIVAQFGMETLDIIENHPERLKEVPDIGPKRTRTIAVAWEEQRQVKEIMLFLHSHNISTNLAIKVYKEYGDHSLSVLQSDPYRLARDLYGVGFKTADRIAQSLGLPVDHPSRLEAGLIYALNQSVNEGHVFLPREQLLEQAVELLSVSSELLPPALDRLRMEQRTHEQNLPYGKSLEDDSPIQGNETLLSSVGERTRMYGQPVVYLAPFYHGEQGVAERLGALSAALPTRLSDVPRAFIHFDIPLSDEQADAIRLALSHPVSILTGGPGTGKTTALKALITTLESVHKTYALASPTGRAAKRLSQATDRPASTIHRMLGFKPGEGFRFNVENPMDVDMLVVDEVSMLDLMLANNLFKALNPGTHLLLVGDFDQLPSVGAGDVLRDVIASGIAPVTRLNVIFRQSASSNIITNAHRINHGEMPLFPQSNPEGAGERAETAKAETANQTAKIETTRRDDFFIFSAETAEEASTWVEELVTNRIPNKFGMHPLHDIQVMAPMYRGHAGVTALNDRLQSKLNPSAILKPEKRLYGQTFRPGDKVMQTQNNYDKETFNGDIGFVFSIDPVNHTMTIDFEGRAVLYDWSEADQLVLAYAVSVHKSQGSEFPAVVIPIITQHYMMLQRNLLYTAITRARELCVLVGSRRAIGIAVRNNRVARRYTALDWRLRERL